MSVKLAENVVPGDILNLETSCCYGDPYAAELSSDQCCDRGRVSDVPYSG